MTDKPKLKTSPKLEAAIRRLCEHWNEHLTDAERFEVHQIPPEYGGGEFSFDEIIKDVLGND